MTHLKQLQEIRDHKIQAQRKERERKEAEAAEARLPDVTLPNLKTGFTALLQGTVVGAKRGYALAAILQLLGKLASLDVTEPFRINGEQIDGAIKLMVAI